MRVVRTARALAASAAVAALAVLQSEAHPKTTQVFWSTDIAPIVRKHCINCHAGDGQPPPLDSYEHARPWTKAIRDEVLSRRMPPWPAARGFGEFSNDGALTAVEIELIAAWVDGQAPLGPGADTPDVPLVPPPAPPADLVLDASTHWEEDGRVAVGRLRTDLPTDRWITAWRFQPDDRRIAERVALTVADTPLGVWTQLDDVIAFPKGVAARLPAGTTLALRVNAAKSAETHAPHGNLALYFGPKPARELRHMAMKCGSNPLDRSLEIVGITPDASGAGMPIEVVAISEHQDVDPLVVLRRYVPAYAGTYWLRRPVRVSSRSSIAVNSDDDRCAAEIAYVAP